MVSLKPGDLSLIPGTTERWKERIDFTKLPSDLHTHDMHEQPHIDTHIYTYTYVNTHTQSHIYTHS